MDKPTPPAPFTYVQHIAPVTRAATEVPLVFLAEAIAHGEAMAAWGAAQHKEDAERWRWAIKHAEWHRSERAAYISIPVDRAADLSCHATRIAAIDKARKTT